MLLKGLESYPDPDRSDRPWGQGNPNCHSPRNACTTARSYIHYRSTMTMNVFTQQCSVLGDRLASLSRLGTLPYHCDTVTMPLVTQQLRRFRFNLGTPCIHHFAAIDHLLSHTCSCYTYTFTTYPSGSLSLYHTSYYTSFTPSIRYE